MSDLLRRIDPEAGALDDANPRNHPPLSQVHLWTRLIVLRDLERRGLLRDPDEPTVAEIREKLAAVPMRAAVGYGSDRDESAALIECVARGDVLALLAPKKPKPTFKPGDWVIPDVGCVTPTGSRAMIVIGMTTMQDGTVPAVDYVAPQGRRFLGPGVSLSDRGTHRADYLRLMTAEEIAAVRDGEHPLNDRLMESANGIRSIDERELR